MEVPKNSYACAICQKRFNNPIILIKHVEFRHSLTKQSSKADNLKEKVAVTGKSLSEVLLFAAHVVYKNCSECQKQFLYTTCSPKGPFILRPRL